MNLSADEFDGTESSSEAKISTAPAGASASRLNQRRAIYRDHVCIQSLDACYATQRKRAEKLCRELEIRCSPAPLVRERFATITHVKDSTQPSRSLSNFLVRTGTRRATRPSCFCCARTTLGNGAPELSSAAEMSYLAGFTSGFFPSSL